jgi:hypothetical protein
MKTLLTHNLSTLTNIPPYPTKSIETSHACVRSVQTISIQFNHRPATNTLDLQFVSLERNLPADQFGCAQLVISTGFIPPYEPVRVFLFGYRVDIRSL